LIASNGEAAVRTILESHFISPAAQAILLRDPFAPDDFEAFIAERQRTLHEAIENLLIKERLDLPPNLRELDEKIERVELAIRGAIWEALNGDPTHLPPHVAQRVDERIQRAAQKNAAMDADQYRALAGKLEFCDLRELQDTITNTALWPRFEQRFANKETLASKFDQLAELRNGIRHSRTVDEITRMEGEAAVLWFDQVLRK
jgi:cell division protein ZapA (FtsZ GTPase activity inhibitor)